LEIEVAAAKTGKYATSESGDTLEIVERPHGGLSIVLVDGQRSGRGAKAISNLVAHKAIALLAEGVRDGAAARAAHDYLYTHRGGKVSATLNIVSVDLASKTLVLSRNNHCPIYVGTAAGVRALDEPSQPVGIYQGTKPTITEMPLEPGITVVVFTDGVLTAGGRNGQRLDVAALLQTWQERGEKAQALADEILARAVALDQGRPGDDISVLVVAVTPQQRENGVRRLTVSFPV
jgi:serine phosphatase RsbU (regulator of sigma subunit)